MFQLNTYLLNNGVDMKEVCRFAVTIIIKLRYLGIIMKQNRDASFKIVCTSPTERKLCKNHP